MCTPSRTSISSIPASAYEMGQIYCSIMRPHQRLPAYSCRGGGITNKRVSNKLFKETFGFKYKYPTFREGITEELNRLAKIPPTF